jgi:PhnB protein
MLALTPFLLFDGNCAEAMTFYQSCLGGELSITRLRDTPMREQAPPELHDKVAYARLHGGLVDVSATDWQHATRRPHQGNTVGMYLTGASYDELQPVFDRLSVHADPDLLDELKNLPFGVYGHLADRYGVHWFFRGDAQVGT